MAVGGWSGGEPGLFLISLSRLGFCHQILMALTGFLLGLLFRRDPPSAPSGEGGVIVEMHTYPEEGHMFRDGGVGQEALAGFSASDHHV